MWNFVQLEVLIWVASLIDICEDIANSVLGIPLLVKRYGVNSVCRRRRLGEVQDRGVEGCSGHGEE